MGEVAVLLLAAGGSSRMRGADKLLQKVDGVTVLRRQARAALDSGAKVFVALAPDRPARIAELRDLPVVLIPVADADEGMGASIRGAVAALPKDLAGVAILPADMPELTAIDIATVLRGFTSAPDQVLRATSEAGAPGHPVVFPARLFDALTRLQGDEGARGVLRGEEVRRLALPGLHATTDLDTPEEWAAWLAVRR